MTGPDLSIIIPCYNEEQNLKREVLRDVYEYLQTVNFSWEVIISNDGSTDGSVAFIRQKIKSYKNFRLLDNPHGGKPSPLWYGIKVAKGNYVLFLDMDQSTPVSELDKLWPYVKEGFDVVIGSRGMKRKNFPLYRQLGAAVFSNFRRLLILPEIRDTQCGFKLFERELLTKAFPKLEFFKKKEKTVGWKVTSFDVELLHIMKKMGGKIKEVTVEWKDEDTSTSKGGGLSKYFKESKEMLMQILRVKINDLRGLY